MSSEEEEIPPSPPVAEVDDDMLRVLVSTDNHLGYCERDPVRGLDSFAAFEEVLYLARKHKVSITGACLCEYSVLSLVFYGNSFLY
jgi:hypothetical protein